MKRTKPLRARRPKPKKAEAERLRRIVEETPCVVAIERGYSLPSTAHHLTVGSRHGAPRLGHRYTVALNAWSHQGTLIMPTWDEAMHREKLGPSYAKEPAAFRELYPDAWLLAQTDAAIGWRE